MSRGIMLGVLAVMGAAIAVANPKDAPQKSQPIVGEWLLLTVNGKKALPTHYEFSTDHEVTVSCWFGTLESRFKVGYEVNDKVTPCQITLTQGDSREEGIFKIEDGGLIICSREGKGQRPKAFGEKGSTQKVFERVKKTD